MLGIMSAVLNLLILNLCIIISAKKQKNDEKLFFLRDPSDGLCMSGNQYTRCAKNALWFISGEVGDFNFHPYDTDTYGPQTCLSRYIGNMAYLMTDCSAFAGFNVAIRQLQQTILE
jgi:hypothetical protein